MAVWHAQGKKKPKKKTQKKAPGDIVAPVIFVAALVVASIFLLTSQPVEANPLPILSITTSEQPGAVGFHEVYVSSDQALQTISVLVDEKPASMISQQGNLYTFEFFASPYEPIGVKPISVTAIDTENRPIRNKEKGFYVGYNAAGDKVLDVTYFTYVDIGYTPTEIAQRIMFEDNKSLNLFYELVDEGEYNTASINALVPLIQNMSYVSAIQNKHFNQYMVTVKGRDWMQCQDNMSIIVPLDECSRILNEENSVIMRYPYYPSAQVMVTENTVDLQPAPATQIYIAESMLKVIDDVFLQARQKLEADASLAAMAANGTSL